MKQKCSSERVGARQSPERCSNTSNSTDTGTTAMHSGQDASNSSTGSGCSHPARHLIEYLDVSIPQSHQDCFAGRIPSKFDELASVKILGDIFNLFTVAAAAAVSSNFEALRVIHQKAPNLLCLDAPPGALPLARALALGRCSLTNFQEFIPDPNYLLLRTSEAAVTLHYSALAGNIEMMDYLLRSGSSTLEMKNLYSRTALMYAAQGGSIHAIEFLLSKGSRIDEMDCFGQTPLMHAAERSQIEAMAFLLSRGSNINEECREGRTPLHHAAKRGNVRAVAFLLLKGANIVKKDVQGWNALAYAVQRSNTEVVKFLLSKGSVVDEKDKHGRTPLMKAAAKGDLEAMEILLSNGARVDKGVNGRSTPLMYAVAMSRTEAALVLILRGSNLFEKNFHGKTILDLASEENCKDMLMWFTHSVCLLAAAEFLV